MSVNRYHLVTLGCPKNQVDSDKLAGTLVADGMVETDAPGDADLIVVNTCAFVEEARQESIDTVLALADERVGDARLVVTGCMAERYGDELAGTLPEVDSVSGFGVPVTLGRRPGAEPLPTLDLLNLPRPASPRPWAYVKVAEGCDRACGFCAIPTFRGPQRSRSVPVILDEVDALGVREVVLVAQDLASFGRDQGVGERAIVPLVEAVADRVDRVRLLYLYPSDLTDGLVDAMLATGVPYFDLSLQHVSRPLLANMRRWGDGGRFRERIDHIRNLDATATFRSNFIVGYPGETEEDHDDLLAFVQDVGLDWCGFFAFSDEAGTHAAGLPDRVAPGLVAERLLELGELQDATTAARRDALIGSEVVVLVDEPGVGRTHREAPEIDGVVGVPPELAVGEFATVTVTGALGPDLVAS
ncbi:MAG: MiaB/RimO family radical SAM methylthiotransferase [Acidimicrobiales bacterium]|jgi:ribosomal protein S12 methylthiotransferase|nr:MiaB/RimO family radical SAM methylthiotransferase [Acidimicrobiales bacterium]|tara:strand:+ start:10735 stop:11979 length:1245 start_codon:yes stop_codon:yes gene_type:complete